MKNKTPEVSVAIPSVGRPSLIPLLEALEAQNFPFPYEIVIILQNEIELPKNKRLRVVNMPPGKGIPFYRNVAIKESKGEIVCFIDDDALPKDNNWLLSITQPILDNEVQVTTAGVKIPLGYGILADSISLLGYPAGGALGFEFMWDVDANGYTNHLCTVNCAFRKDVFLRIGGFKEELVFGCEDVEIASRLLNSGIQIKYVPAATITHLPRTGWLNFWKWHFRRGRSFRQLQKSGFSLSGKSKQRIETTLKILRKNIFTIYGPVILLLLLIQYSAQLAGFLAEGRR